MAIPGRKLDQLDARAKVKIGEKNSGGRGAKSLDHFISDDRTFLELVGPAPKTLRLTLPYPTADENFSTGLERWLAKRGGGGNVLTCYTKDGGPRPVALRFTDFVQGWDEVLGEPRGNRTPVLCKADGCAFFKDKTCKPMGRLQFFLDGDTNTQPLQIDTKGWNSIENLSGYLKGAQRSGPLNAPGRVFELSVAYTRTAAGRFPVLSIEEVNEVPMVVTPDNVTVAEALAEAFIKQTQGADLRRVLADLLDVIRPTWREQPEYIDRIKEVGPEVALQSIYQRYDFTAEES